MCRGVLRSKIYIHCFYVFHICYIFWYIWFPNLEYTSIHVFYLFSQSTSQQFFSNTYYGISIIYFNVFIYIFLLYLFFSLLFLYDIKKIKTLNNLKVFNRYNFTSLTVVLAILSMSGIPPLAGFVGKFLLFNFLFLTQKYIFLFGFSILNFFSIYFYVQNLRFLISKTQSNFFLVGGYYVFFNKTIINILVLLNIFNFFSAIYAEDFLYMVINIFLYKNV